MKKTLHPLHETELVVWILIGLLGALIVVFSCLFYHRIAREPLATFHPAVTLQVVQ